jgi:uncharacterized OsmC-like protein
MGRENRLAAGGSVGSTTGRCTSARRNRPRPDDPRGMLLVSIGTCFALSCWAAFAAQGLQRVGFEVGVTGRKAPQLPSRLANIELEVTFDPGLPRAEALAVTASAEQLCTVTNTVTSEPQCAISVNVRDSTSSDSGA